MQIGNSFYNVSSKIENNTILNRSVMDIGGYEIPYVAMSNNKIERRERIAKAALYFSGTFISPLLFLPLINRTLLMKSGIIKKFWCKDAHIIRLSNKFLKNNVPEMIDGINKLGEKLNLKKEFTQILNNSKDKDELRKSLIDIKAKVLWADILATSLLVGSIPWYINNLSKMITKRAGYSGEFKLADKEYTDKMTEKHEKNKVKKMSAVGITMIINSLIWSTALKKAMLKNPTEKIGKVSKIFRNKAEIFDYTDGIFMSRMTYFVIDTFSLAPSWLTSTRDKHELRSTAVQTVMASSLFFGGDYLLNNIFGQFFDKKFGTKLINREGVTEKTSFMKKLLMPVHKLDEIKNLKELPEIIKKTQKFAIGMYWGNFAIIMLLLGFGVPFVMNRILRTKVKEDLQKIEVDKKNKQSSLTGSTSAKLNNLPKGFEAFATGN